MSKTSSYPHSAQVGERKVGSPRNTARNANLSASLALGAVHRGEKSSNYVTTTRPTPARSG